MAFNLHDSRWDAGDGATARAVTDHDMTAEVGFGADSDGTIRGAGPGRGETARVFIERIGHWVLPHGGSSSARTPGGTGLAQSGRRPARKGRPSEERDEQASASGTGSTVGAGLACQPVREVANRVRKTVASSKSLRHSAGPATNPLSRWWVSVCLKTITPGCSNIPVFSCSRGSSIHFLIFPYSLPEGRYFIVDG